MRGEVIIWISTHGHDTENKTSRPIIVHLMFSILLSMAGHIFFVEYGIK
jgi:hypothetical protein